MVLDLFGCPLATAFDGIAKLIFYIIGLMTFFWRKSMYGGPSLSNIKQPEERGIGLDAAQEAEPRLVSQAFERTDTLRVEMHSKIPAGHQHPVNSPSFANSPSRTPNARGLQPNGVHLVHHEDSSTLSTTAPDRDQNGRLQFILQPTIPTLVTKQRSFQGTGCIPDKLADRTCSEMGLEAIFATMNDLSGTTRSPSDSTEFSDVLRFFISRGYDFGVAYGKLRQLWPEEAPLLSGLLEIEKSSGLSDPSVSAQRIQNLYGPSKLYDLDEHLAKRTCAELGVLGVQEQMNKLCCTNLQIATNTDFRKLIGLYSARGLQLGNVYPRLWFYLWSNNIAESTCAWALAQESKESDNGQHTVDAEARRIWDLYSNRVLPFDIAFPRRSGLLLDKDSEDHHKLMCVSHSWAPPNDRNNIQTPINSREWPVPIPKESSLDCIRIEMLNMGAEFVWLDVLCLRQQGGASEHLRAEEWKIDVPTIGRVYRFAGGIVTYMNGLGVPFRAMDLDSHFHWCNRAWTLQETKYHVYQRYFYGGSTPASPNMYFEPLRIREPAQDPATEALTVRFEEQLSEKMQVMLDRTYIFGAVQEMGRRFSTKEIDKIAGLAYIFQSQIHGPHPFQYVETDTPDEMWHRFTSDALKGRVNSTLFFLYPGCGSGAVKCLPSWSQLQDPTFDSPRQPSVEPRARIAFDFQKGRFVCNQAIVLRRCAIEGMDTALPSDHSQSEGKASSLRHGTVTIHDEQHEGLSFAVTAQHSSLLNHSSEYALIGAIAMKTGYKYWAVGELIEDQYRQSVFCKICTLLAAGTSWYRLKGILEEYKEDVFVDTQSPDKITHTTKGVEIGPILLA